MISPIGVVIYARINRVKLAREFTNNQLSCVSVYVNGVQITYANVDQTESIAHVEEQARLLGIALEVEVSTVRQEEAILS